ncbi:two-component system, OmpR family, sensor histidine kinase ChvG [Roseovarius azorensis]|uniref:histidine kinase n=1 Tax=Roseovarius azorensis TaxID=1287727 RepID=A0A1H7U9T8_9RHOB|nr:sensor histidine kinase [Roseovarius azorensis]SEL93721.1 two-component system, OmpR family, sensor histidine kinase ChvG [Roseovarius azorensis]
MALAEGIEVRDLPPRKDSDLVLGDDFVAPDRVEGEELSARRARRGWFSMRDSSLTRKIITFNLIALNVLVVGILYLSSSLDNLAQQRTNALVAQAALIADAVEAQLPDGAPVSLMTGDGVDLGALMDRLSIETGTRVFVFDRTGTLALEKEGDMPPYAAAEGAGATPMTDFLTALWERLSAPFSGAGRAERQRSVEDMARDMVALAVQGGLQVQTADTTGGTVLSVAVPVLQGDRMIAVVALANTAGEIDRMARFERERVLQMFLIATLVSVGLSFILASTISNPLAELAEAAEIGRDRNRGNGAKGRIRIPDLTARPDEIGRLSGALRGMVAALYHRIDSNEQFAADVAHEIKNPLASLRSAVGTMRIAKREDQRERLLEVIEHDVRRLDRLVSDISNASRLDSELVREEQEAFDLLGTLRGLGQYLGEEAEKKGVEFITDFPAQPIVITGLEARLAQVFVNLIANAISFCEEGDAIRVWARRRANRVLVVVEDTGPGIPDQALEKVFQRFYSERPEGDFGNNSGLGLAISKQIVEAHDGVIWAENIRPTHADATSDPLGARFVVGLPV